MKAPYTMHEHR